MTEILACLLEITGLILLVFGYRQSNRKLLPAAALCLWLGAGVDDLVTGFRDGVSGA